MTGKEAAVGRRNKSYSKDLHQQAYDKLTGMQAFGQSKKEAVADGTEKDKIFSYNTYQTYWKHTKYFIKWIQEKHPECTTLKAARRHVNEWLQSRVDQVDEKGQHLSAWTIQTEAAALNKLYQIDKADPNRFQPPKRNRSDIKRSRVKTARDAHFSVTNNDELIRFCRGTGSVDQRGDGRQGLVFGGSKRSFFEGSKAPGDAEGCAGGVSRPGLFRPPPER